MADIPVSEVDQVGRSWCLTGADGATIANGATETITPPSGSRVVFDIIYSSASGGSNRWSLTAGGNVVFADTDIVLDDASASLLTGGKISITKGSTAVNHQTNDTVSFAIDEQIIINNIATGGTINAVWHYEELR